MNSLPNIFSIARRIGRPLILDGAMGSLLQSKFDSDDTLWMSYLNLTQPEHVLKLHKEYIKAGADIITTNTFRTNPAAFTQARYSNSKIYSKAALDIAKKAVKKYPIVIAGSNPPAEDCYKINRDISNKELDKNHSTHIRYLLDSGAHLILNETFSHMDEIEIVCRICSAKNIPFIISLYFTEDLRILSGEKVKEVIKKVNEYNPLVISFNCVKPATFIKLTKSVKFSFNWGVYLNCGAGNITDESISCGISPEEYGGFIKQILVKQPSFVGACCGSSPAHIKQLKRILDERNNN